MIRISPETSRETSFRIRESHLGIFKYSLTFAVPKQQNGCNGKQKRTQSLTL